MRMAKLDRAAVDFVQSELKALADPAKAVPMAAYMKTDMPFYGVQKPDREAIHRQLKKRFIPSNRREYEAAVRALWELPHREEKYAAVEFAIMHEPFITSASLPLYERLIREGAWWDLVDGVAVVLVGGLLLRERTKLKPLMDEWVEDDHMWIRRTALLAHNKHRNKTDYRQLFDHCLRRAPENEFFIRKAIGWALREYSYAEPERVRDFLTKHRSTLSGLSYREGAKQLVRSGRMARGR